MHPASWVLRVASSLPRRCAGTPPLNQAKAWRARRREGSARRNAAAKTPNSNVPHVSSLGFKARISVPRNVSKGVGHLTSCCTKKQRRTRTRMNVRTVWKKTSTQTHGLAIASRENSVPTTHWIKSLDSVVCMEKNKTPLRLVPSEIQRPDYADHPRGMSESEQFLKGTAQIKILPPDDIEGMRVVCRLAREVLDIAAKMVKPGVTTEEIDHAVHLACNARNCYPSPLNYYNFPKSCCTSVNEVICHGIPDRRPLQDGDILNVDITVYHNGFHGDLNETFYVGEVDEGAKKLVQTTYECLMQAIDSVKPGVRYRELGNIIQKHAQANSFSVVRSYCGHGIHRLFHTAPNVPHYAKNKAVGVMKPGHVFTIEPMICEGGWQDETWPDGWTAVTRDGKRSAQFEHTLLVTDTGCDILTRRLEDDGRAHFLSQM
ncbi:methionine aminopeptidase 1 isoform X1 [Hippocampus zosterae]|uniref:methionine aminopeptidase 1 isoform X1 n=1 Tax=Hippocampus zosterae TaxID=109293 RepID=UPI00223DEB5F|nr:methionine aminopeptidase 1 isoform X1 [Hippocampus zosterae]